MPAYKDEKTGKWYCKFYYRDWNGQQKQKKKAGFALKREALQWEADFITNHAGTPDATLSAVCEKYLELKKATWKPLTYQSKESAIRTHIMPHLGNAPINEITPLMVSEWQRKELETCSRGAVKLYKQILTAILNFAVNNYNLPSNPCSKAEKITVPRKEMRFISVEEFKRLEAAADDLQFLTMLKVLFWSGIRWGELAALTAADVTPEYISVNKTLIYIKREGHSVQQSTKSENSLRKVPIHDGLYNDVQAYINALYGLCDDMQIFTMGASKFRKELHKACSTAGIEPVRIHDLRHSHVALLIHLGLFPNAIAKRIGDIPDTVINTYAHIYEEDETAVTVRLAEMDK